MVNEPSMQYLSMCNSGACSVQMWWMCRYN